MGDFAEFFDREAAKLNAKQREEVAQRNCDIEEGVAQDDLLMRQVRELIASVVEETRQDLSSRAVKIVHDPPVSGLFAPETSFQIVRRGRWTHVYSFALAPDGDVAVYKRDPRLDYRSSDKKIAIFSPHKMTKEAASDIMKEAIREFLTV